MDGIVGFLGGITGGLAGFPGACVTVWCSLKGWDERHQRGVYQPFILIMQAIALGLIIMTNVSTSPKPAISFEALQFVPAALLGTLFGLTIFARLSDRGFMLTVNLLLLISGIGMLM